MLRHSQRARKESCVLSGATGCGEVRLRRSLALLCISCAVRSAWHVGLALQSPDWALLACCVLCSAHSTMRMHLETSQPARMLPLPDHSTHHRSSTGLCAAVSGSVSAGGNELEVAMRAAGHMHEETGVNTAISTAGCSRAEALVKQADSLRSLKAAMPHMHESFWSMLVRPFQASPARYPQT